MVFASCASTRPAPVFQAPSLAPVEQAVTRVEQHVSGAKDAAKKLAEATAEANRKDKAWQDAYNQLTQEQDAAWLQIQSLKDELKGKQQEIDDLTSHANQVVDNYNKLIPQVESLRESRHAWVKKFWIAAGAALLLAAWTTKRLWLPLVAGMGSL